MAKILLVEDEVNIASFIERGLREFGHEVYVAYDGAAGWELTQKNDFQLLILDIIMPKLNGLQLCKQYRQRFGYHAPVIMLTARSEEYDKLTGLESGADDYVVKPFSPRELVARVKAVLARTMPKPAEATGSYTFGDLSIDTASHSVKVAGQEASLTPKEFDLLVFLVSNKGIALSREKILQKVWNCLLYTSDAADE